MNQRDELEHAVKAAYRKVCDMPPPGHGTPAQWPRRRQTLTAWEKASLALLDYDEAKEEEDV